MSGTGAGQSSASHDPRLDGLRAVAAIAVVAFHCQVPFALGGSLGVDVFFVLSGWLITGILMREIERTGGAGYWRFMGRRLRRLVPALAIMLAVATPFFAPWAKIDAIRAGTYTMNLFSAAGAGNNPLAHTWSLAGEMQFYLVWPIVVTMLAPLGRARAAWMLLIAWAVMTLARESARAVSVDWQVVYFAPWFHSSGMLLGGALALRPLSARFGQLGLAALIILLAFTPISQPIVGDPTHGRQIGTWAVAITEVAAALVIANPPAVLGYRPLPWLGRISYGLYLWHVPIIWALPVMAWPLKLCAVAGLSIAAAAASYYIVERRFLEPSGRRNLQHRLSAPEGSAGE